jgi:hypothetical protein
VLRIAERFGQQPAAFLEHFDALDGATQEVLIQYEMVRERETVRH